MSRRIQVDRRLVEQLRARLLLPWRTRPAGGNAIHPGIQTAVGTAVLQVGVINARPPAQQAEMVRYAAVAASTLPDLLLYCADLERQLAGAGILSAAPGKADEILAMLELAGYGDEEPGHAT